MKAQGNHHCISNGIPTAFDVQFPHAESGFLGGYDCSGALTLTLTLIILCFYHHHEVL
jgi:hypothetical protein